MTQSMTDEDLGKIDAAADRALTADASSPHRRSNLPRTFRGMRAEDMIGLFADAIDYEFLETVLGCRGRKVPKDIGI
jgi:hypothetical protein